MPLGLPPSNDANDFAFEQNSSLWNLCIQQLAQELPEQQFNTWIKPLKVDVALDGSKVVIWIANRFKLDWIRAQYFQHLSALLEKFNGQPIKLELALLAKEHPQPGFKSNLIQELESSLESGPLPDEDQVHGHKSRLNTALTFETLVEGTANRMARAAAMHVASIPGQLYNPLFIYGGVGLGKTHLMHAVGNK